MVCVVSSGTSTTGGTKPARKTIRAAIASLKKLASAEGCLFPVGLESAPPMMMTDLKRP